jgi:hypothetical protein
MIKGLFASLFIHFICFQLMFAGSISELSQVTRRTPASFGYEIKLEDLKKQIEEFKVSIKGKELEPECEEELLMQELFGPANKTNAREEKAFFSYVDSFQANSCGVIEQEEQEECKGEKVEGFIDAQVKVAMELEAQDKEVPPFKLDNEKVRELHQKATTYMQEVRKYMSDDSIERSERVSLLVEYLGGVALPMRDLVVVMRAYTPREYDGVYFYESLLPEVNAELIGNDAQIHDLILHGPNKMVENFNLEFVEGSWGRISLKYNANESLARDIVNILKAPTAKNYVRASKWMTLQMMITQMATYDGMQGIDSNIEIPKSCQNHFNGSLPDEIPAQYTASQGDGFLNRILTEHKLVLNEGDTEYIDYYLDHMNKNPLQESYNGLMPFEKYKAAMQGVSENRNANALPSLDDYSDFQSAIGVLRPKAMSAFVDRNSYLLGFWDYEDEKFQGAELFDKILVQPETNEVYEYTDVEGETVTINHIDQRLSLYLTETMQRHKVNDWELLLSESLKRKLSRNRVQISFPPLYGASVWRMWALSELEKFFEEYKQKPLSPQVSALIANAFNASPRGVTNTNAAGVARSKVNELSSYLKSIKVSGEYTPARRFMTDDHISRFGELRKLWNILSRSSDLLPVASPDELTYMKAQMKAGNPWARTRLSYLVLSDELNSISGGDLPSYSQVDQEEFNGSQVNMCLKRDVTSLRNRITNAAKELGINRVLRPGYANGALSKAEKKTIWEGVIDGASPLFQQKNTRGEEYYHSLDKTASQTFLSKSDVEEFVEKNIPEGLRDLAWEGIDEYIQTDAAKTGTFLGDLYKMKGQTEEQLEFFEEFAQSNGINSAMDAKLSFLYLDSNLKFHVLKSLLRGSASLRRNALQVKLQKFCNLEPNDHESLKTLFYSTTKAQNELNRLVGAPTVPSDVMEKINSKINEMSPEEWTDMWLGIGAGLLGVAAMLIGGACTGLTGGLCAPLGVAMMAAGASAMTMQVALVTREYSRKVDADRNAARVKEMEELGFANRGSSSNVSRGWFWTAFEAISIIPLIGVVARSVRVGSKLAAVSTMTFARNVGKTGFRSAWQLTGQAGQTVVAEADVRFARLVLGFDTFRGQSKEALEALGKMGPAVKNSVSELVKSGVSQRSIVRTFKRIRNLRRLYANGKISAFAMVKRIGQITLGLATASKRAAAQGVAYQSKVIVNEAPRAIDEMTAKTVSDYFGGNPKGLHYLLNNYSKRLPGASAAMKRYEEGTSLLGKFTLIPWARNGFRSLRNKHLHQYAEQIARLEKEAAELVAKNGSVEDFVLRNVDELTDIFMKIPVRKRELPYMFFVQGGPHLGKSMSSIPLRAINNGTYWMSNGIVMRKFFNARSRLIYESMKSKARGVLGLNHFVASETALEVFKSFQHSVSEAVENLGEEGGAALMKQYDELEDKLAASIIQSVQQRVEARGLFTRVKNGMDKGAERMREELIDLDIESLRKVLFHPENAREMAVGNVLWSSVSVDDLFELKEVGSVAHRVIRELSEYDNVDEFTNYLNALKVISIKRDPDVVEVFVKKSLL